MHQKRNSNFITDKIIIMFANVIRFALSVLMQPPNGYRTASGHSLQNEYHRTTVGICPEGREGGEPRYFAPQQQTFLNAKHLQEVSEAHADHICSFTGPVQRLEEWLTPTC